jgi:hypothetical protein
VVENFVNLLSVTNRIMNKAILKEIDCTDSYGLKHSVAGLIFNPPDTSLSETIFAPN